MSKAQCLRPAFVSLLRVPTLACLLCLTACIPYPVYKTLQPEAFATITDSAQRPIEGASVNLVARSYPSGLESRAMIASDSHGRAKFDSEKEWRAEVMALHGSAQFAWRWCVEKRGFVTYQSYFESADIFDAEPTVSLVEGESTSCIESQ